MAYGVANQFGLALYPESLHQKGAVILHCPLADAEMCGNLRIRLSLRRQLQHLALPRREGFVWIERARLGLFNVSIDGNLRHGRTEVAPARGRLSHGMDQILLGPAFKYVADRAIPERLGNESITAAHG